jgi:hypothetical protein
MGLAHRRIAIDLDAAKNISDYLLALKSTGRFSCDL